MCWISLRQAWFFFPGVKREGQPGFAHPDYAFSPVWDFRRLSAFRAGQHSFAGIGGSRHACQCHYQYGVLPFRPAGACPGRHCLRSLGHHPHTLCLHGLFFLSAVMEIFIHIPFVKRVRTDTLLHETIADMKSSLIFIGREKKKSES